MKELIGKVVSKKMQKTAVVEVRRTLKHPLYKKIMTRTKKFKAHDEIETKVGDMVRIQETAPISKEKHFKVVEIINPSHSPVDLKEKVESK